MMKKQTPNKFFFMKNAIIKMISFMVLIWFIVDFFVNRLFFFHKNMLYKEFILKTDASKEALVNDLVRKIAVIDTIQWVFTIFVAVFFLVILYIGIKLFSKKETETRIIARQRLENVNISHIIDGIKKRD